MHEAGSLVYRALEIVTARPHSNFVTNVHFIYRDFDFDLHTQKSSVKFLNLQAQTYISNKTDLNVEPADDAEPPELEGVKAIARSSKFVFDNANDRIQFMKMLLGWDLIFLRPIRTVQLKGRAHVRSKKIEKATVALWKKQTTDDDLNTTHLALTIRCNDSSPDSGPRWTTAALDMNHSIKEDYKSSRISISNLKIRQGAEIDSDTMGAVRRSGGHPVEPHQRWTIILPLDARLDIEEFAKQIKPVLDNWPGED